MKKIGVLIVLLYISTSFLCGQNGKSNGVEIFKLKNGLTVVLKEDHTQPKVFGGVITKAGAKDDPDGATGMAHYQEHMLFKGTQTLGTTNWKKEKIYIDSIFTLYDKLGKTKDDSTRHKIQKLINEQSVNGGKYSVLNETSFLINMMGGTQLNAGTGPDQTVFYNQFPPNQLEKWLDIYAERFYHPVFRTFQSELEVIYEEKNMYDDQFFTGLFNAFNKKFFKKHPYGQRTVIGTNEDLKNPSLTKMYQFFQRWYRPNNMALVIVGDFDKTIAKSIIESKFEKWESAKVPKHKEYKEESFNGREFFKVRMSPIPIGIIGYRSPKNSDKDALKWEVTMNMLSNQMQTGLLDQLMVKNKLTMVIGLTMPYQDYGETIIAYFSGFFKSIKKGEKKIMVQLDKLKKGEFSDSLLEDVKANLYNTYQHKLESMQEQAMELATSFSNNKDPLDFYKTPKEIKAITKDDIVKIANKYFTDNRLVMYSKMGFPKHEKLKKPDYKPVITNTNAKSEYRKNFEKIPSTPYQIKPIDFNNDIKITKIRDNYNLYCVQNPLNDIARLNIRFNYGNNMDKMIPYIFNALNEASPKGMSLTEFKNAVAQTHCSYQFYSTKQFCGVSIDGQEQNLNAAVTLINKLIMSPTIGKGKIKQLYKSEKINRRMENTEVDNVATGLFNYLMYGENSEFVNRLTTREIKKLTQDKLFGSLSKVFTHNPVIFYTGEVDSKEMSEFCKNNLKFIPANLVSGQGYYQTECKKYNEKQVFVINHKRAKQSKVFLFINQDKVTAEEIPYAEAFNMYFGGGFSGLVLQEIREYRSLAYGAAAKFQIPKSYDNNAIFYGYVATQSDKTIDALKVFDSLLVDMPQKPERMGMIKQYLINSAITSKPDFRNEGYSVYQWKLQGYKTDPITAKVEAYKKLTFDDIVKFYKQKIKDKAYVIAVVGDISKIDVKELAKFGKVTVVEPKQIFKN